MNNNNFKSDILPDKVKSMEDWRAMLLDKLPKEKQPRRRYPRCSKNSMTLKKT